MRWCLPASALVVLAGCGGSGPAAADCARGLADGDARGDGIAFAFVSRDCGTGAARRCTISDREGPIDTEVVEAGIAQDCAAFSQFLGLGDPCAGAARTTVGADTATQRADCDGPPWGLPPPRRGSATIEARAPDPIGVAPARYPSGGRGVRPPPWGVLVWRARDGSVCHEPGQVIRGEDVRPLAAYYAGGPPKPGEIQTALGSLRPDAKFGTGRQYFHLGRFLPYPVAAGGSCGDPAAGAGLIFSREQLAARQDLGPARTIVDGVAGPHVRGIWIAGRAVRLSRRRAFVAVLAGTRAPRVRVTYEDGSDRTWPAR